MPEHKFYSIRTGKNKNTEGFSLIELSELFLRVFYQFKRDGFFDESFGFYCC